MEILTVSLDGPLLEVANHQVDTAAGSITRRALDGILFSTELLGCATEAVFRAADGQRAGLALSPVQPQPASHSDFRPQLLTHPLSVEQYSSPNPQLPYLEQQPVLQGTEALHSPPPPMGVSSDGFASQVLRHPLPQCSSVNPQKPYLEQQPDAQSWVALHSVAVTTWRRNPIIKRQT
ncbi:hypothetical protein IFM61606_09487 [Aspergillus udagawae]|nr:hypothetical protein IFM61606_09487 [Aspergillus udagawae]